MNQFGEDYKYNGDITSRNGVSINVNDLIKYYIEENHSKKETIQHFKVNDSFISRMIKHYNIKKPRQLSHIHNMKTCLEKYGDENYNNIEQCKKTCMEKYGVDNVFKDTERIKNSYVDKLGVTNPNKLKSVRDKIESTNLEKYGVKCSFNIVDEETGISKKELTCMEKYGGNSPMCSDGVKSKFDFKDIAEKAFETKKKNGTTNTSKPQKQLIEELINIFGDNDVIQEYKEDRYPFHCDAYIKSIGTFVELNLYFTHGYNHITKQPPHLFSNTSDDLLLLNEWKQKAVTSDFYKNAIDVWTKQDVYKNMVAKHNNLNYVCIYTNLELEKFIKEMKEKYDS